MDLMPHGFPFKIMLHPIFIHFPIAFYFLEFLLITLWIVKDKQEYRQFSCFVFWLGYALMLVAMAAGLFDAGGIEGIRGSVKRHVNIVLVVFAVYTARAIFYWATRKEPDRHRFIKLAGAIIGNLIVAYAAFLGGLLVYQ